MAFSSISRITGYGVGSPKIGLSPQAIVATRDPRTSDYRFPIGQDWINQDTNTTFKLCSVRENDAVWIELGSAGDYPITPYVVGPVGLAGYQTIQSAINAANAAGGGMVWVQPGTYIENLTFYSGIQISSPSEQSATIVGIHTPPSSGTLNINRLTFQSATHIFSSNASGTAAIIMEDCSVNVTNGYTFNLPNWQPSGSIAVFNIGPFGTNDGFINNTAGATVAIFAAGVGNGSANAMEISGPTFFGPAMTINCPVNCASGTNLVSTNNQYFRTFTFNGTSTAAFYNDSFVTGATPAITQNGTGVISLSSVVIKSTNNPSISGAGAGVVTLGDVTFLSNAAIASTITKAYAYNSNAPISPYVVGAAGKGNYQTVQSAINAANSAGGGTVWIQQGQYIENLTLFDQVYLVAVCGISQGVNEGVEIRGTHTPPTSGHVQFNGIFLSSTTHIFNSNAAGSAHIQTANCETAPQNGYVFNLPNWTGILEIYDCNPGPPAAPWAINDGGVNNTGGSPIIVYNSGCGNGTNVMTVSGNCFFGQAVTIGCPINLVTGSNVTSIGSQYNGTVTLSNNSILSSYNDSFVSGASPAITMSSSGNSLISNAVVQSTNNPAITGAGAGTLSVGGMTFTNNALMAGTLTVAYQSKGGVLATANAAGASPQVVNARTGQVIFTDVIANGAYGTLTLTNSIITASSVVIASASCSTANSACSIVGITPGAGSVAFRIYNAGSASTAANVLVNFWVLN